MHNLIFVEVMLTTTIIILICQWTKYVDFPRPWSERDGLFHLSLRSFFVLPLGSNVVYSLVILIGVKLWKGDN